jgi:hypothetical protein
MTTKNNSNDNNDNKEPNMGTARFGHILEYADCTLGVCFLPIPPRRQLWGYAKQKLVAAGFAVSQDADGEGCAIFNPENRTRPNLPFAWLV